MEPRIKLGTNSIEKTGSQTGHRRIEGKKGKRKTKFTYLGGVRFKKIGSGKLTTSCFKKRKGIRNLCANHEDAVTARNRGWREFVDFLPLAVMLSGLPRLKTKRCPNKD